MQIRLQGRGRAARGAEPGMEIERANRRFGTQPVDEIKNRRRGPRQVAQSADGGGSDDLEQEQIEHLAVPGLVGGPDADARLCGFPVARNDGQMGVDAGMGGQPAVIRTQMCVGQWAQDEPRSHEPQAEESR